MTQLEWDELSSVCSSLRFALRVRIIGPISMLRRQRKCFTATLQGIIYLFQLLPTDALLFGCYAAISTRNDAFWAGQSRRRRFDFLHRSDCFAQLTRALLENVDLYGSYWVYTALRLIWSIWSQRNRLNLLSQSLGWGCLRSLWRQHTWSLFESPRLTEKVANLSLTFCFGVNCGVLKFLGLLDIVCRGSYILRAF